MTTKEWSEKSSSRCKEFLADIPSDSELHRSMYPRSFNAEAVFPDGKSRVFSVYINPDSSNYEDDALSMRTNASEGLEAE